MTVYATSEILFASTQVSFDNTRAGITKSNGDPVTTVEEAIEAITEVGVCPAWYIKDVVNSSFYKCKKTNGTPICRRATSLHTEKCTNSNASSYCQNDGYALNADISYGKLGTSGGAIKTGDAFDCDVNGDGVYDALTERFYYVSDYYDTNTGSFDDDYAVLIYYTNVVDGSPSDFGTAYYGTSGSYNNWHGPTTAISALPNVVGNNIWRNDLLVTRDRKILSCNNNSCAITSESTTGGTITYNTPAYRGKAARLLNLKELAKGCGTMNATVGELKNCNFVFEETKYANAVKPTHVIWVENPHVGNATYAWQMSAFNRNVGANDTYNAYGVRPVIDVPYTKISVD